MTNYVSVETFNAKSMETTPYLPNLLDPSPCYNRPSFCVVCSANDVILVTHVAVNVKVMNQLLLPMHKSVAISIVLSLRFIT